MKITKFYTAAAAFAALLLLAPCGHAQSPAATPAATSASSSDRIEQFRQKMNEYLKTALKVTDEEWSIIQPLLENVQTKQRETLTSRFNFPGSRRGGSSRSDRPTPPETDALKAAIEDEGTAPADIKARLEAVRAARKKALAELDQAREDLRKVLTQRQEATLVMVGLLE